MTDRPDLLDRLAPLFSPPDRPFDGLLRRQDRKRRRSRIVAGVVGLAVGLSTVLFAANLLSSPPPGPVGPTPSPSAIAPSPSAAPSPSPSPIPSGDLSTILHPGEIVSIQGHQVLAWGGDPGTARVLVRCDAPCKRIDGAEVSADGRWLAYQVDTCGSTSPPCDPRAGLWVMDSAGEQRQLTQSCPAGGECVPYVWHWSQQGAMLAVVTEGDSPEVTAVDPATGVERAVASVGAGAWRLSWSPDGSRLLYTTKSALHSVDLGSGETSVIASDVGEVESIAWSPDGNRIAFDSFKGDRDLIEVMDADGSNRSVLVEQGAPQGPGAPAWSPDGTRIAYVTTPGGFTDGGHGFSFEVWVIGVDGSGNTRLFQGRCCIQDWKPPVWSPDGRLVAFWDDTDGSSDWLSTWLAVRADGTGGVEQVPYAEVRGW